MQFQHLGMRDRTALRVLFHETQPGKVICHFPAGTLCRRGNLPSFFDCPHLFQGKRIALDCGRRMSIANPRVLLQGRDPGHLNRRCQNPLAQSRDLLYLREQYRRNRINGFITHLELVKHKSSYWSSAPSLQASGRSQRKARVFSKPLLPHY